MIKKTSVIMDNACNLILYYLNNDYQVSVNLQTMLQESGCCWSKKTRSARGSTDADICTNCVKNSLTYRWGSNSVFLASRSPPHGWLCFSQMRQTSSQILTGLCRHTSIHSQSHGQKQTSIRCNHTHNTYWEHLKCTQVEMQHSHTHTHTLIIT